MDEAGFDSYLYCEYARSLKVEKVHERIKGRKYERTSILAGKREREIIALLEHKGTMHGDFFQVWFGKHLLSEDHVIF